MAEFVVLQLSHHCLTYTSTCHLRKAWLVYKSLALDKVRVVARGHLLIIKQHHFVLAL